MSARLPAHPAGRQAAVPSAASCVLSHPAQVCALWGSLVYSPGVLGSQAHPERKIRDIVKWLQVTPHQAALRGPCVRLNAHSGAQEGKERTRGRGLWAGHVHGAHTGVLKLGGPALQSRLGFAGPPVGLFPITCWVWVLLSPGLGVICWEQGTQGTGSPRDPLLSPAILGSLLRKEGWTPALVVIHPEAEGQPGTARGAAPRGEAEAKKQGPREPPAPLQGGFS